MSHPILYDVWAVDLPEKRRKAPPFRAGDIRRILPTHRDGVALSEFLRRANQDGINRLPLMARALIRLRLFRGRICRLEAEPKGALAVSFGSRLTPEDRARSFVVSGAPEGLFRVVYRFENEQLLEISLVPGVSAVPRVGFGHLLQAIEAKCNQSRV